MHSKWSWVSFTFETKVELFAYKKYLFLIQRRKSLIGFLIEILRIKKNARFFMNFLSGALSFRCHYYCYLMARLFLDLFSMISAYIKPSIFMLIKTMTYRHSTENRTNVKLKVLCEMGILVTLLY